MSLKIVSDLDKFELTHKHGELLELLVDTDKGVVYHINPVIGHEKSVEKMLGKGAAELNMNNAGHLVSAILQINSGNKVISAVVGKVTSFELSHEDIKHTSTQIAKAQAMINKLINESKKKGEVSVSENLSINYVK